MFAVALAAVMASERVYWYWSPLDLDTTSILTFFYGSAAAVALIALGLTRRAGIATAIIASGVYALVVEGVITPVIYEDGPLPLLYLMFLGWHGVLAFVGFVYLIRKWALAGNAKAMALASLVTGVFWGVWALSSGVNDVVTESLFAEDGGSSGLRDPMSFALYAGLVTVVLAAAHVVMDRVWPKAGWRPSRLLMVVAGMGCVWMTATLVIPAVFWAPLKLGALAYILWRLMRRADTGDESQPTVIDELGGRIRYRTLLALAPMPVAAVGVYTAMWPLRNAGELAATWWWLIAAQWIGGMIALVWAIRRTRQPAPIS